MAVAASPHIEKTDEQKAITEMVRQFADEQILPNAEHYDHEDAFPEPIVEQMKELGLFGVTIPGRTGGWGSTWPPTARSWRSPGGAGSGSPGSATPTSMGSTRC